jgi:tetratricopeptide (TPR) repeat protein
MGLLGNIGGKIGDKINEKIDETLNPKVSSTRKNLDYKERYSADMLKKYGKKITELEEKMSESYDNESYNEVYSFCTKILSYDRFHESARRILLEALVEIERYDDAYELCSKLLQDYPNDPNLEEKKGWILFKNGNYIESIPIFESLIQKIPYTDPLALNCKINKAYALANSFNYHEAVEFCTEQLKLHKNDETLLMIKNKVLEEIQKEKEQTKIKEEKEQQTIREQKEQVSSKTTSDFSVADELSKFNKLKEQGAISEEEFSEMKKKLLDKM